MTPDEMKRRSVRVRVEAFERGGCATSLRELPLARKPLDRVHRTLLERGFRVERIPLAGPRARDGQATWLAQRGSTTTVERAASELAYVHADGGLVRLYPERAPFRGLAEAGIAPFARKSVLMPRATGLGLADEACVVADDDHVFPRVPRPDAGLKFDPGDVRHSFELADTVARAAPIQLTAGVLPELPWSKRRGLSLGFTILSPAYERARMVLETAINRMQPPPLFPARRDARYFFFTGFAPSSRPLTPPPRLNPVLAAIGFHDVAGVVTIEPFGYEASVVQLAEFLGRTLDGLDCQVLENATGRDVTRLAKRHPYNLLGPDGPILDGET